MQPAVRIEQARQPRQRAMHDAQTLQASRIAEAFCPGLEAVAPAGRMPHLALKAGLHGGHHHPQQLGVAQQQSRVRDCRRHPAVIAVPPEIPPPVPWTVPISAALEALEILAHTPAAPGFVAGQFRDVVPVTVVGRDEDHRVMRGATTQRACARIEDSLATQVVFLIPLLLHRVGIVMNIEFPRELLVFRAERMEGGDLVVDRLFRVAGFENEHAVAGFRKPHGHRPATGAGSYDNEIVFLIQVVCGHRGPRPRGTIDEREPLRKRVGERR